MSPVATSDAAFRGGACPTPEYTVTYTGNYTTSADASVAFGRSTDSCVGQAHYHFHATWCFAQKIADCRWLIHAMNKE